MRAAWLVLGLCSACAKSPPAPPVRVIRVEAPKSEDSAEEVATGPASAEPPPAAHGDPLIGSWRGIGVQDDNQTWEIAVTIRSTEVGECATVQYPGIPCSGVWNCTEHTRDGDLLAQEKILQGRGVCIDNGTMTMRVTSAGTLDWSWEGGGGVHARATLRREN
jgi:hypothetical protein